MTTRETAYEETAADVVGDDDQGSPAPAPTPRLIPLDEITASPTNPRKHIDQAGLDELTASVRDHGVLQPILVRPVEGGFEIVAGERRFRAACAAGLESIPALVRCLDDREVLEIQVIENLQRSDLHPLEEAEGYRQLHEAHHLSVEDLAARVGKSKAYVYARMKLCSLPAKAKKLWWDGKLNPSTALLVARIPDPSLSERAAAEIANRGMHGEPMTYRAAAVHIEEHYMLDLRHAPFKTGDAQLVPKAGACASCPKRTGNQRDLFGDVRSADVCTDPPCYRRKVDAHGDRLIQEAEARGLKVLGKAEAAKIFQTYGDHEPQVMYNAPWVAASDRRGYFYGLSGKQTLATALGKHLPPATLARDPRSGQVVELYRKDDIRKAAIAAGKIKANGARKPDATARAAAAAQQQKARLEGEIHRRLTAALVASAEASAPERIWEVLALGAIARAWHDTLKAVCARRGIELRTAANQRKGLKLPPSPSSALEKLVPQMSEAQLRGLTAEIVLGAFVARGHEYRTASGLRDRILSVCGVKAKPIEAAVRKELAKPGAKGKKSAARREPPAGSPCETPEGPEICCVCGCTDEDCSDCVERTGEPCTWVEPNLCSACVPTKAKKARPAARAKKSTPKAPKKKAAKKARG